MKALKMGIVLSLIYSLIGMFIGLLVSVLYGAIKSLIYTFDYDQFVIELLIGMGAFGLLIGCIGGVSGAIAFSELDRK